MGIVYVISGSIDVMVVVDVVNSELNVMGVVQGSISGDELPAVAVVVRDGAIKDDKAFWGRVVLAKLSKVQIGVKGVSLRCGGASVKSSLAEVTWEETVAEAVESEMVVEGQGPSGHSERVG